MSTWGEYKDDHSVLMFQTSILNTRPHPQTVTQYDTHLAQSAVTQNDVWTRRITNPLINEWLQHPLQNNITIMQIYNSSHYTTLITDNINYYHYDGLKMQVPEQATLLHNHLRHWYGTSDKPPVLQSQTSVVLLPYMPTITDGWNCAMHMLLTSLSAIYQENVPILQYSPRHADQLSRMHLRYVITG